MTQRKIRRALLSVSDKTGIEDLAGALYAAGAEIISSSGTARLLNQNGVPVTEVSAYTDFPELMDGRVKTLHPKIHAGLLARGEVDRQVLRDHDIGAIDLLAVNLYPFAETVARDHTRDEAIEQIDIGGVALIRAAAKNHHHVIVIVEPADYAPVISALQENGGWIADELRGKLAAKAFSYTAAYDAAISRWFARTGGDFPADCGGYRLLSRLRYGENPHQQAAFYRSPGGAPPQLLQGKPLSFNNLLDADSAVKAVNEIDAGDQFACVIVKHNSPCGAAIGATMTGAYERAHSADPDAAFGGIIAFNRQLDGDTAGAIIGKQFAEVISAPAFSGEALEILARKKNIRALVPAQAADGEAEQRSIAGGLLMQDADTLRVAAGQLKTAGRRQPSPSEVRDLLFAWQLVKHARSNAIVLAKDRASAGIGAGQVSRFDAVCAAAGKAEAAGRDLTGAVMASEAFFPFADSIAKAKELGVSAIIQPGGSKNDGQVITAADECGIAMVFTGTRHFKH